jgi:hypothetical protein
MNLSDCIMIDSLFCVVRHKTWYLTTMDNNVHVSQNVSIEQQKWILCPKEHWITLNRDNPTIKFIQNYYYSNQQYNANILNPTILPKCTNRYFSNDLQSLRRNLSSFNRDKLFVSFELEGDDLMILEHSSMPIVALKYIGPETDLFVEIVQVGILQMERFISEFSINGHLLLPNNRDIFTAQTSMNVADDNWDGNIIAYVLMSPLQYIQHCSYLPEVWIETFAHCPKAPLERFT